MASSHTPARLSSENIMNQSNMRASHEIDFRKAMRIHVVEIYRQK